MSTDDEAQQDEMLAMESIFESGTFQLHPGEIRSGQIKIRLDLPEPFYVKVETAAIHGNNGELQPGTANEDDTNETKYKIEFLPPLVLHFTLPKHYPSQTKPNFTLSSTWLHRASLSVLCQKLDELWNDNTGMGILFTWANYLQANTLSDIGITDYYDVAWQLRPNNLSRRNPSKKRGSIKDNSSSAVSFVEECNVDADQGSVTNDEENTSAVAETSNSALRRNTDKTSDKKVGGAGHRGKKRKCRTQKTKTASVDQRAASDMIPRKEGKDVGLLDYLLSFNEEQVRETFQQSTHSCDICFTMKTGQVCVRFRCGHVFCEECVTGFFSTNITEGNVDQVKCLAFNCKMRPSPELVKELVGDELFERYDQILLKRALESMSDITYCPRPKCHNPVICDPNEKCAFCTACSYTFCSICKMVYHGVESCRFKDADMKGVFKKYTEGSTEEKQELLRAYGEKQLKVLVENVLSEQWIQKESKPCPHCKVPIEKFEGCNKVTCFKCNTYFCWICLKQLETGNPYFHFNDPSSKCYNNLFQDVDAEDGPGNEWFIVDDSDSEDDNDIRDLDLYDSDDYDDFDGFDPYG